MQKSTIKLNDTYIRASLPPISILNIAEGIKINA
jgi:hypothetical protein